MAYLISNLKDDLETKFHGSSLNKLKGSIYNKIYEAARNVLNGMDPVDTIRTAQITNAIYDDVYSYVAPTDLKDDKIVALYPQANATAADNFSNVYSEGFTLNKFRETLNVRYNSGVKTLRLSKETTAGSTLNTCDSVTANGTWAVGGSGADIAADSLYKISGSASLKFTINSGGTSSYIENSTMTAVDLSGFENNGAMFAWVYIPSTTVITAVALRWGSSSSDYYSVSVTAAHDQTAFVTGWNLLRFDWQGLTPTGTPVDTAIDYVRVTFTHTTAGTTPVRVDSVMAKLGAIWEIDYYSKYLFRNTSGTWIEKPTAETDIVNLDTTGYNVLLYEVCLICAHELQGEDSRYDMDYFREKRKEAWDAYTGNNKSQTMKKQSSYYSMRRR
jgi:hypothetical protein